MRQNNQPSQESWRNGSIAGFIATIPMTIFMLATQRFLPKHQRYELPPEIITKEVAHYTHIRQHMNKQQVLAATMLSHFGYGATMGTLYSRFAKKLPFPPIARGIVFGLCVWLGSYLGLLPISGMSESAHSEPVRRNLLMIAAHVIWGGTTGAVTEILDTYL